MWLGAMVLVGIAGGTSCLLELDSSIACGDGYVDREAGEDCDPGDPSSFELGCLGTARPEGLAACNPETCTIINTIEQCAVCGDGRVDGDEECDGQNLDGDVCPGGVGVLQCDDECRYDYGGCVACGNGEVDTELGEECDPNKPGDFANVRSCEELPSLNGRDYAGGVFRECREDCLFSRISCSYCGNLQVDGELPVDLFGNTAPAEVCDGWFFDEAYVQDKLSKSICYQEEDLRPVVVCEEGCTDIQPAEIEQLCCVKSGRACPLPGSSRKCCYELEGPPGDTPCVDRDIGGLIEYVCK